MLRYAVDSTIESLLKMEQTNFSKRTKARKRKVSHFYRSTLCNSIIFIRSNNAHLLLSHSHLHSHEICFVCIPNSVYFWLNIHLQFLAANGYGLWILACYMVMNMSCFATDTIAISPNCAFISLKINHAALCALCSY